jgi:PPOX class probable F420-dependent enzyme
MPGRLSKAEREKFLRGRRVAVLVTTDAEGIAVPTPIWYLFREGAFYFRTADNAIKTINVRHHPRVSICVQDERPPYRAVTAYGTAEIAPADKELAQAMPRHYLGFVGGMAYQSTARGAIEAGEEITLIVRPDRYTSFDFGAETPWYGKLWLTMKRVLPPWL